MGDGEQQEGSIWEAVMEASHYKLDNLVGIIDRNRLQIDGWVKDVMNVEPLAERYRSFGWEVIEVDGHDIKQVVEGLQKAKDVPVAGKPTSVIGQHGEGQGRQLHGKHCRMAWPCSDLRRDGKSARRTGIEADHRLRRAAEKGG